MNANELTQNASHHPVIPSKTFSLYDGIAVVVGIVIGAGIFQFPTLIAMNVVSGSWMVFTWLLGGLISLVGVLCYAELACAYPDAGGDYHFLYRGLSARIAFVFAWTRMVVIQPGSIAMMAFVAGQELSRFFPLGSFSEALWAALVVLVLSGINIAGVHTSNTAQKTLTGAILLGLLGIVVLGIFVAATPASATPTQSANHQSVSGFGRAMVFVLLTFGGWNEVAYISSEMRAFERNIVRSLLVGIAVVTLLYVLVNVALYHALGLGGMRSFSVYHDLIRHTLGERFEMVLSVLILLAALSTANVTMATGARSNYAFGRDFRLLPFLGRWDGVRGVPMAALGFQTWITLLLVVLGATYKKGLTSMVDYTSPAFWFFFLLTGVSLIALRWRDPNRLRPFRTPLYPLTPVVFVLFCAFMLHSSISYAGRGAGWSVAVMAVGFLAMLVETRQKT